MSSSIISLGSGQMLPWETHPDLSLLHQLKLFNFPIPNGLVFLNAEKVAESDWQELESELSIRELSSELSVRAFVSGKHSLILSKLSTLKALTVCCVETLKEISSRFSTSEVRVDFLISERINGNVFGSAVTRMGFLNDSLNFKIKSPENDFPSVSLPIEKIALGERKIRGDFRGRIQDLLRSIRRALGEDDWTVTWVDNGSETHLTSIQKWSAEEKLDSDFFLSIPFFDFNQFQGSTLEKDLLLEISPKLFHYFHHWSPELSLSRDFIRVSRSHVVFNFSLLTDFLSSFGLSNRSTRVLNVSEPAPKTLFNSIRFWRNLPRLVRFFHDLTLAPGLALRLSQKISNFQTEAEKSFAHLFLEWQNLTISSSHALYRLWGSLYVNSFIPSSRYQQRVLLAEKILRQEAVKGFARIQQAIEVKALGWYSRGILASPENIWTLSKLEVLRLEESLDPQK